MSGPSTQAPFQSKNMFAFILWLNPPAMESTQTMSHSHNMFSMANLLPWAFKSCLPLGPSFLASLWVGFFASLLSGHPVWSGKILWLTVPSLISSTKTTASITKVRLPKNMSFGLSWLEVLCGTGSLVISLLDWACSTGFAGLLPRTLLSICYLEQTLDWEWVPLPLIGQWFLQFIILW